MIAGVCKVCGCSEGLACPGGCAWADEHCTICSACVPKLGDEQLLALFTADMQAAGDFLPAIDMAPVEWFAILGALQLACSHPDFHQIQSTAQIVEQFALQLGNMLGQAGPATAEVVRRGWRGNVPEPVEPAEAASQSSLILPDQV